MIDEYYEEDHKGEWRNEIVNWGAYTVGKISCDGRELLIHFQGPRNEVFLICLPDVTLAEIQKYEKNLKAGGFNIIVLHGVQELNDFIKARKNNLDPLWLAAADYLIPGVSISEERNVY